MGELNWKAVSEVCRQYCVRKRVKSRGELCSDWDNMLIIPHPDYIETGALGPVPLADVEYVEIDPVERKWRGRLVSDLLIDHRAEIESALTVANVPFVFASAVLRLPSQNASIL